VTIHNQLTESAELQSGIARAAGLGTEADGVIRLGETLDPTIDPWSQPEWAYLSGERLGAIKSFAAAVAAEFGIIALGNAAGSGNIVVVDACSAWPSSAATLNLEVVADSVVSGTLSAAGFAVSGRDRRFGSTQGRTFLKTGTDPGSTFGVAIETQLGLTTQSIDFKSLPVILKPGDDLIVICTTVNVALVANFKWRERKAFKNELGA
jgi:hypothetical protein